MDWLGKVKGYFRRWIEIHQDDLLADWQLAVNGKKPFPVRGLDQ